MMSFPLCDTTGVASGSCRSVHAGGQQPLPASRATCHAGANATASSIAMPGLIAVLVTMSDVGIFRISVEVENPQRPGERRVVTSVLVDTGAELSWLPAERLESLGIERFEVRRFRQASGAVVERWVGTAWVHASGKRAADDVVFA